MAYEKTVWAKGEVVTAEKLNKIEDGIYVASEKIGNTVMTTEGNQLNDNAETSENLASVGFVEKRIGDLIRALNPLGRSTETEDEDKKEDMSRKILQEVKFVDGRAFRAEYIPIPLATTKGTGLMRVGANLVVTTAGEVKVSDNINSTDKNPLVLNNNVTIGHNTIDNDTITSYGDVTVEGLLVASRGITSPTSSALTIGTATVNEDVTPQTVNRSALTVQATATFNGQSTFNESSTFNNNVTVTGQLNAPNMVAYNINSAGNNLVLNENVTIGKNTNENNNTSYGNITIEGLLTAKGNIGTPRITSSSIISSSITSPTNTALTIGTVTIQQGVITRSTATVEADTTFNGPSKFTQGIKTSTIQDINGTSIISVGSNIVNIGDTNNTKELMVYGSLTANNAMVGGTLTTQYIKGVAKSEGLSPRVEIADHVHIIDSSNETPKNLIVSGATTLNGNFTVGSDSTTTATIHANTIINGQLTCNNNVTFGASANTIINGQLTCNNDVIIQADSQGINWITENQDDLVYRSLIKENGAVYSLFAQYGESSEAVHNTILEYKPNITNSTLSDILNIGTAIPTTGNINTADSTMVNTINIAAKDAVRLKTVNAGTSIVLDSNTKVNGTLEIINDTDDPLLYLQRTSGTGVGFTYTRFANLGLLPLLPITNGDYVLHVDSTAAPGSQYTWVQQTT